MNGLAAVHDADQLTVGVQRVGQLRHAFVAGTNGDVAEIGNDAVGTEAQQFVGVAGAIDTDDEPEPAVATGLHAGLGVFDDNRPLHSSAQPAGQFQQHSRIRLARQSKSLGDDTVDAHAEQVAEPGRLEDPLAVAARRVDPGRDPGACEPAYQHDSGLEDRHTAIQRLQEESLLAVAQPEQGVLGAVRRCSR